MSVQTEQYAITNAERAVPVAFIKECFVEADGVLRWRARPVSHFSTARARNVFNAQMAGVAVKAQTIGVTRHGDRYFFNTGRVLTALSSGEWPPHVTDAFFSVLPGEEWRPAHGYAGLYSVSNMGRVRTEPRTVVRKNGLPQSVPGRILKTPANRSGYQECRLGGVTWLVHQVVLYAFAGPRPPGMHGCHNDGDPSNCRLENLRWDTPAGNAADSIKHGATARGERVAHAKLTAVTVLAIRADERSGSTIAADYGVTQSHVSRIKTRDVWTHI